jgi:hypothetical protein
MHECEPKARCAVGNPIKTATAIAMEISANRLSPVMVSSLSRFLYRLEVRDKIVDFPGLQPILKAWHFLTSLKNMFFEGFFFLWAGRLEYTIQAHP